MHISICGLKVQNKRSWTAEDNTAECLIATITLFWYQALFEREIEGEK